MPELLSDAIVLFGATGDLAYEQVFPALQAMTRHGHLDIPVVDVAKPDWTVGHLRARARESFTAHGGACHVQEAGERPVRLKRRRPQYGDLLSVESDVSITLAVRVKKPCAAMVGEGARLVEHAHPGDEMEPYERLLGDALRGDKTLFGSEAGVEAAWRIVDQVLNSDERPHEYDRGSWGPAEAEGIAANIGGRIKPQQAQLYEPGRARARAMQTDVMAA